jgi:hypothetical protein
MWMLSNNTSTNLVYSFGADAEKEYFDSSKLVGNDNDVGISNDVVKKQQQLNNDVVKEQQRPNQLPTTINEREYEREYNPSLSEKMMFVVPKYKLVFHAMPKVACTEWKTLFRRMMGHKDLPIKGNIHFADENYTFSNLSKEEQDEILNDPTWTKAVFFREPKERILSAFLNKFVHADYFARKCCKGVTKEKCLQMVNNDANFMYFLRKGLTCKDPHWLPQTEVLYPPMLPHVNYIGYFHTLAQDSERLLKQLINVDTNHTAWEEYGMRGWGENGDSAFMQQDTAGHATDAHDLMRQYYDLQTEKFVEEHCAVDWNSELTDFVKFKLFDLKEGE